jgi:hypothetical protein
MLGYQEMVIYLTLCIEVQCGTVFFLSCVRDLVSPQISSPEHSLNLYILTTYTPPAQHKTSTTRPYSLPEPIPDALAISSHNRKWIPVRILMRRILNRIHHPIQLLCPIHHLQKRIRHIHSRRDSRTRPDLSVFRPSRAWHPVNALSVLGVRDPSPKAFICGCAFTLE